MRNLRRHFLLKRGVIFLNHGSFGATPKPVFQVYQRWQRELEGQPVEFLGRRFTGLMRTARRSLAEYINTSAENLVYTPNVTVSVNIVARSLKLGPGDEVLTTDHEYGACGRTWRFLSREKGFVYKNQPIPLPLESYDDFIKALWKGVTPKTKVIFLSHITSPTAMIFPITEVCARARREGILTLIDGAHAPGQLPLDMHAIGADFYGGNLHKWLCAPKGAGFLYARPEAQELLKPLIVSWGYESETPSGSPFIDLHEWTGTRDYSAYLSVPSAIEFQAEHDWDHVRIDCHEMVCDVQKKICGLTGLAPLNCNDYLFGQFVSIPLPDNTDIIKLKDKLYKKYRIEVPLIQWNERKLLRVSIQGYNTKRDANALVKGLQSLL
jgi:isopenicillin-N epimerase